LNQFLLSSASAAGKPSFRNELETRERQCLAELIHASDWWKYTPQFADEMMRIAKVARTDLNGKDHTAYLFLFEGGAWCGTAGCPMLIGERQSDGRCHLLYDGNGVDKIIVLRARDHGYRRLYLPCQVRFDGRYYQQLHPVCPTVDVQR
jgi:hypothetical protein